MAERPIWRGQLRLALVSCPVALYNARRASNELHFHYINPTTGNRVRMVTLDAETDQELSRRDLVKGYEFKKDNYVLLDDEDFDKAKIDSSSVVNVAKFVPAHSIDPVYYDASYYVAPDGDTGRDVYVVLRDAIRSSGKVALSRLVISRRERAVAIMPMDKGLVLHTLHDAKEIADPAELFSGVPSETADPEMVQLATLLIDRQSAEFEPADMEDRYEKRLREVIAAKLEGEQVEAPPEETADHGNVIDLMAALKRSLGQVPETSARGKSAPTGGKGGKTSGTKRAQSAKAAPAPAKAEAVKRRRTPTPANERKRA